MATPAVTGPRAPVPELDARRIDPFSLPTATTSRFLLLVVLTLTAAATTFDVVTGASTWSAQYGQCAAAARTAAAIIPTPPVGVSFIDCLDAANRRRAAVAVLGAVIVGVMMISGWLAHPRIVVRGQRLCPLDPVVYPKAAAEIARLVAAAHLRRPPTILVDPLRNALGGRAFGRWPHYQVKLTRGTLRATETGDPSALTAILRHELAHLRNRDVDLTVFAIVSWWALLLNVAFPLVIGVALTGPGRIWSTGWHLAIVLLAVLAVRAAVLRSREHFADVDASVGVPDGEPIFHAEFFPDPASRSTRSLRNRAYQILRPHPATVTRAAVVRAPETLLRARFGVAAATGLTVGVTLTDLRVWTINLTGNQVYGQMLAALVLGALAAATVAIGMWRETLRALVLREPLPTGTGPAVGLALGILAGQLASPQQDNAVFTSAFITNPVPGIAAAAVLILACVAYTRWVVACAAGWLSVAKGTTLRPALRAGQAAATLVAGAGLATWTGAVASLGAGGHWQDLALLLAAGASIAVMVPALLAIGYPLAAGWLRGDHIPGRSLFLGTSEPVALPRPRYRLGLASGVASAVGLIVLFVDRVLPTGVAVGLYARFGGVAGPGFDSNLSALLALLGVIFALLLAVCVSVSVLASGRGSAGTGGLHGAAAGMLTGYLLTVVLFIARTPELCRAAGTCDTNLYLQGIGALMVAFTAATLAIVALTAPFIAASRLLLHPGRNPRPRWPGGVDSVPRETRRRRVPVAVSTVVGVVVVVTFAVPVTSAVVVANGITDDGAGGDVPPQILRAPGPGPVGSVGVQDACGAVRDTVINAGMFADFYVKRDTAARKATATDDPAMRTMGKQLLVDNRAGLITASGRDLDALNRYCYVSALTVA